MIVYDLRCGGGHVFEAWFGSSADYGDQRERGLLSCPICGDGTIEKAVMAPNVGVKGNRGNTGMAPVEVKAALASLAEAQGKALEDSEWVGRTFAKRARAMHDGDEPQATIHGHATVAEAKALLDDGVPVAPLPFPVVPPAARN